ncbi:E3 ubiquitin-protein ligase MARCH6 [Ceratobasidium sp. AG-Ba]|nr:E3 ubiquitin-protein ligase MARCH6 [Ceratobasidium sp. AG-Ba]
MTTADGGNGPAEEEQPLFYPCKCSGTIRYIHQECLTTWLAHSKKRSCDVCKYEYSFTKVYKPDMPNRLPPKLFFKKLSVQFARIVITSLRLVMISIIWLAMLPYLTLLVWRFYFWTGEALAYWVVGLELPNRSPPQPQSSNVTETSQQSADNTTAPASAPPVHTWAKFLPHDLGADIFKGQIITIAVVIVFLTIFLLREWIIQNARPGVFGDEEVPEGAAPEGIPPLEPVQEVQPPAAVAEAEGGRALQHVDAPVVVAPEIPAIPDAYEEQQDDDAGFDLPLQDEREDDGEWEDEPSDASSQAPDENENETEVVAVVEENEKTKLDDDPVEREDDEVAVSAMLTQTGSVQTTMQDSEPTQIAPSTIGSTTLTPTEEPAAKEPDMGTSQVSSELGNDLSLPSSFAFSSPATASHSVESSLDGTRPPSTYGTSSLSSAATEPHIQSSVANFSFTFTPPHASTADLPEAEAQPAPMPKLSPTFFGTPGASTSKSPLNPPSPDRVAPTPLPFPLTPTTGAYPQPTAGPSVRRAPKVPTTRASGKHMSASTPAFDKHSTDFDEFRFSFSSTPTTLSQASSRQSSRPPLLPSTPGVDESIPLLSAAASEASSPGLALYRPPEDMHGYFDRSTKAKSSAQELEAALTPEEGRRPEPEARDSNTVVGEPVADEPVLVDPEPELDEDDMVAQIANVLEMQREGLLPRPREILPPPVQDEDDIEEDVQDMEPLGDDDMDGALEAIGVRGPITSVFQNVFLMIFIIDLAIAVGIWMPFTMGKTTALLFLQPEDVLAIVRFPIIIVRILTDPVVDGLIFLLNLLARPLRWGMARLIPAAVPVAKKVVAAPPPPKAGFNFTIVQNTILHHWDRLVAHSQAAANVSVPRPSPTNVAERIVFSLPAPSIRSLEDIESRFAALGRTVRLFSHAFARRWQQLAVADGTSERAFAITLGYLVLTLVMGIYLGVLNAGAVRGAARALRNAVKQQLIVIKVALFIGLELLVFPTGCGVVLDAATLPLFESATLAGRIAFYDFAPLTAFFCHWLVGTIFMYQFALTLGACRAVMRPGAMWFIKDPQDASFSPIRDILDKHVLTQLRKLAVSAVMYTLVIVIAIGSVAYTLRFAPVFSGVLPLRGNMREPLSEIPVDLLFLHLVVPPTVKRLTIGGWTRARLEEWWKYTARQLRLSSFMFGKLYPDELVRESSVPRPMQNPGEGWTLPEEENMHGRWLRVPKSDNIAFLRDAPVLIEVDQTGQAKRDRGREVMAAQDEETRRAGRQPEQDYIIVHVPPAFGVRCMLLVTLLWITAATVVVSGTAGPILLGRWLFAKTTGQTHVHDGYALVVGWYVLWGAWRLERAMRTGMGFGRAALWFVQVVWLGFWLGVVTPILLALAMQMYIVLPLRVWWNPGLVPVVRVAEEWAIGLVLMKIGWQAWRLRMRARNAAGGAAGAGAAAGANPNPNLNPEPNVNERGDEPVDETDQRLEDIGRAMEQIIRNGFARVDALGATRAFVLPVCGGLALVVGAPAAGLWLLERALPGPQRWGGDALLTVVYPGIFSGTAMVGVWRAGRRAAKRWLQGVRDEEFLVELRLRNLETERK